MTDTDNNTPPMPAVQPKPGYKWVFVPSFTKKNGTVTKPMWRQGRLYAKPKRGRPPHSERPRFTGQAHALYLRDKLAIPLTFLITLKHMTINIDPDVLNALDDCIEIIKEARLFIGRFTSNKPMEE